MVEWNKGTIICLIGATVSIIGIFLGWWTITGKAMGFSVSMNFNPIFGMTVMGMTIIPPTMLTIIFGLIALGGAGMIFGAIKAPILGIIGGLLAIAGALLFIYGFYTLDLSGLTVTLGLFGQDTIVDPYYGTITYTSYLGVGWFMTLAGAVMGIIGSRSVETYL